MNDCYKDIIDNNQLTNLFLSKHSFMDQTNDLQKCKSLLQALGRLHIEVV